MSVIATAVKHMLASGMPHEAIVDAVAEMESATPKDIQAERRRAADRERKRLRNSAESAEKRNSAEVSEALSPFEVFPQTPFPKTPNPIPPSPPKGGSSPTDFEAFWEIYPNKVGKADARKKFGRAVRSASIDTIMAGLKRYVAKTDDRPWCNPSTWLHQERWADQPAVAQPRGSPPPRQERPLKGSEFFYEFAEMVDGQAGNRTGEQGDWDDASGVPILTIEHQR